MLGRAATNACAICSAFRLPWPREKQATSPARMAASSSALRRTALSLVRTAQPQRPASASHSASGASSAKCALCSSTWNPAARRSTTIFRPSDRSTTQVNGSGGFTRLAPDRVLDLSGVEAIVLRELGDGLASAVALGHDAGLDARAGDDRLAETAARIDHDALRAFQIGAQPGIEPFGNDAPPLDTLEAGVEDLAQEGLLRARHVEKLACVIDEQAHAIGAEARVDQRALNTELAADEPQRLPDALHRDSMHSPHRRQYESLDQVRERERQRRPLRRSEKGGVLA